MPHMLFSAPIHVLLVRIKNQQWDTDSFGFFNPRPLPKKIEGLQEYLKSFDPNGEFDNEIQSNTSSKTSLINSTGAFLQWT
jgi:hypothetical protein